MHKVALEKPSIALKTANAFGVLGYISLLLEWVWITCLLAYPLIKNGGLDWALPPRNPTPSPVVIAPAPVNGFTLALGVIISIVCLGIAIYALYTMPRSIGKAGSKITHKVADSLAPALTHNQKISKKAKLVLAFRTTVAIKIITAALPVVVALTVPFTTLSKDIILLTTLFVASWAVIDFAIQFTITKLAKLNPDQIW